MAYSNDPRPNPYASIPSPVPNIDFPTPYWINKLKDLIIIACLNPDIAYAALVVPAAAKMAWSVITPSTKQLIEEATGQSWLCGSKQTLKGVQYGEQIAASQSGRFIYGLLAGLDIAAYHAFFLSTGAEGVIDFASYAKKFQRVCSGDQSPYRGLTPVGGFPWYDDHRWQTGPSFFNAQGSLIGQRLTIHTGQIGAFIAWCSFSCLSSSGGVVTSMALIDEDTGEIYDADVVDNLFSTGPMAIVRYFTTTGRALRETHISLQVAFEEHVEERFVPVNGGCYVRAWSPDAGDAPPYWNVRDMIKASKEK